MAIASLNATVGAFMFTQGGLETFFLVCFGVGFVLSLLSFVAGSLHFHLPTKWHVPHFGHHGHAHVGHAGGHGHGGTEMSLVSPFNVPSLMAFLSWFGAVGFLTLHHYRLGVAMSLAASAMGGTLGGWLIYRFLRKVMSFDVPLDPEDYRMEGALGTLNIGIRPGGTGELVYVQGGTRKTCAARTEDASAIEKGVEVAVVRYHEGVAYVKRWEDFKEA